ncbi:uncharacterized mitochondrial protein AtMg00810-like [Panicum virgatum]|uniref:uncharacterized mitochondrial protein AtMg00810-like n=1 Tax=Panicum virgatum TaxID=38727 RepID=UPI0019D65254|nr:uncharacterized mitochondrial protein AtMg00810-like [Panicum virgatum]
MANCKPVSTPVDTKPKSSAQEGSPATNAMLYRSIAVALQYLTLMRQDIAYAVNQACLFMHAPSDAHWNLIKRILRYLCGTINDSSHISAAPSCDLMAYSDVDWAGCSDTRRSTSGYCVFLGKTLI